MRQSRKKLFLLLMLFGLMFCAGSVKASAAVNVVKTAKTVTDGKWVKTSSGRKYKYSSGGYAKNVWLNIDGGIYCFNSKGIVKTGWFTSMSNRYYADRNGKIYVNRWLTYCGSKYFLRSNGVKAVSRWQLINGKYYYFNSKGKLVTGRIFSVSGKYYCVDGSGARVNSSWVTKSGKTYYCNSNGVCLTGWHKLNGNYYYFNSQGVLQKNKWIGDYYVDENGIRLTDCVVDGYTLDSTGKKIVEEFTGKYIFVGDSRIVGMSSAVSASNTVFIGKVGSGYSWLKSTASTKLAKYLNADANAKVIFAFGVNDLGNISSYISYYKKLIAKYPNTEFYMMSVNPVNETTAKKYGYTVKNSQIKTFNTKLKKAFSSRYVDTYTYLTNNGFSTSDGIHYKSSTYKKIYNYVISAVS